MAEATTTFTCTYDELKKVSAEFIRAIPSANLEALDAGLKCFQLHCLGLSGAKPHEQAGAEALMRIVTRQYLEAEAALLAA